MWFQTLLIIAAIGLFAWQTAMVVAAERGRRKDLVRRRSSKRHDFNITFLVPYIDPVALPDVQHLLRSVNSQSYPKSRLRVMLGCVPKTIEDVHNGMLTLPVDAACYTGDEANPSQEDVRAWLIDRALAAGHSDLLVMLNATDVIKPDFCGNVATMAYQVPVFQGYVATRNATSALEKQQALSNRLRNRVELAGRYHLGLSCVLQNTGWVIQPDILERVPYGGDPMTFSLRLMLSGQRVTWAPSATVFERRPQRMFDVLHDALFNVAQRIEHIWQFTGPAMLLAFTEARFGLLVEWALLFRLPAFAIGMLLCAFALADMTMGGSTGVLWAAFALGMVAIHVLTLTVARCKLGEMLHSLMWTPLLSIAGVCLLPLVMVNLLLRSVMSLSQKVPVLGNLIKGSAMAPRYQRQGSTRLNEELPALRSMMDGPETPEQRVVNFLTGEEAKTAPDTGSNMAAVREAANTDGTEQTNNEGHTSPVLRELTEQVTQYNSTFDDDAPRRATRVAEKMVPISNGRQQVEAHLQVHTSFMNDGAERYSMSLVYRSVSFSTEAYRILDQAFYELESKLMGRGLTIVSCGSCGYYYHPTADVADRINSQGVCLFGKQGIEVDLDTDAVTVVSDACHYHAPLAEREAIVSHWQDSLAIRAEA